MLGGRWQTDEALEAWLQQLFAHWSWVCTSRQRFTATRRCTATRWRAANVGHGDSQVMSVINHVNRWTLWSACRIVSHCVFIGRHQRHTKAWLGQATQHWLHGGKWLLTLSFIFTARRYASALCAVFFCVCVCVCVCLSVSLSVCLLHPSIVSKWLNLGSCKQRHMIAQEWHQMQLGMLKSVATFDK